LGKTIETHGQSQKGEGGHDLRVKRQIKERFGTGSIGRYGFRGVGSPKSRRGRGVGKGASPERGVMARR